MWNWPNHPKFVTHVTNIRFVVLFHAVHIHCVKHLTLITILIHVLSALSKLYLTAWSVGPLKQVPTRQSDRDVVSVT